MKPIPLKGTKEIVSGGNRMPAGGYVCRILAVTDFPEKEYIKVEYDVEEGEYANYYTEMAARFNMSYWPARYIRSYKEKARGFFKHFLSCIDKSNGTNFIEASETGVNETMLKNKLTGLILAEEEYDTDKGERKVRLYVAEELPVEDIRQGKFKVPELKKLPTNATGNEGFMDIPPAADDLEGLPF